ncbi:MAG TPA: hypothetical protein VJL83_03430 [Patescibacteria group bacterium]|nr:hypothetical protein [Patescibacteria group bacterium]
MQKVQITLTEQETNILSAQAARYGYRLSRYVKYLISDAVVRLPSAKKPVMPVDDGTIPTFKLSKKTASIADKAYKEYKAGKAIRIHYSVKELLE